MEKIIHFTVPKHMSSVQSEAIDRAKKLHPNWEIKIWQDPIKPAGFLLERYWAKANSGAQFADLIRLDVLYRHGGVYVDSDLMLLKPLDELGDNFDFFIASEDGLAITNAIFGAQKSSPVIRALIDELINNEPDWSVEPHTTTGPGLFSAHLKWRKDIAVLPRESFYPYNWNSTGDKKIHRHSYGEHLWEVSWKPKATARRPRKNTASALKSFFVPKVKSFTKRMAIASFRYWDRFEQLARKNQSNKVKSYQCSGELVVRTIHGFNIVVDGRDVSLTPTIVFNGYYELAEENFIKRIVKGGDWVIDVGSNVGSISLLAAQKVGPFGRIFSFEPNPRPMTLMAKSAVLNWVHDRIIRRPVAVGENRGTVKLTVLPDSLGGSQVDQHDLAGSAIAENAKFLGSNRETDLDVPCTALDIEFPVNLPIKLLKVDVEGYEGRVLAGAKRLLENRCIDFVMLELLQEVAGTRWNETVKQVEAVTKYGYTVCTLTEDADLVEHKTLVAAIQTGNRNIVLAARDQHLAALATRQ